MMCWYRLELQMNYGESILNCQRAPCYPPFPLPPSTGDHSVRVGDRPASAKRDQPTAGLHPGRVSDSRVPVVSNVCHVIVWALFVKH